VIATIEDATRRREVGVTERERRSPPSRHPRRPRPRADEEDHTTTLSPAVRRAVLEHGVDPSAIKGTGKDGRLTKEDVLAAAKAKKDAPAPSVSAPVAAPLPTPRPEPEPGERREERVKMTRLRQTIARRLKAAQEEAALLTTFNDCDMSGGDRGARGLQGPVRQEARRQARLHELLRQGRVPRAQGRARGQCPRSKATRSSTTTTSTSRSRSAPPTASSCPSSATSTR
jgi:pyruvate/2-oxoglutarate dehydrogenase complex dihydrolipoamide acyltransferase (E2) component